MDKEYKSFKGTGWKFPVEFNKHTVEMLTGDQDIANSLDVLFATNVGERIMHPNYGTALFSFVFMPVTKSMLTYMQAIINDEILFNEARIRVNEIIIEPAISENGRLDITVEYTVNATNNRYNYVYPFYMKEATNLER